MAFDPLTAALSLGSTLIDRLVPDKTQAAAAKATLVEMQLKGELDQITGQLTVDQAEAGSKSTFVAGWRPFVGWACGVAFAYVYILQPFMQFALVALKINFDLTKLPVIDVVNMLPVLLGMLGLGAMRSFDKSQGTGSGH
jgi:hypothetical protein